MTDIEEIFGPVIGLPCWLVTKVHGSIVTMQFGQPKLVVSQPRVRAVHIIGVPDMEQRFVHVEGDWLLTVYLCQWSVIACDVELAHCESDDMTMARALKVLNGQQLSRVHVEPSDGSTDFVFDLGCTLKCRPAAPGVYGDGPSEMWWFSSDDAVVAVRDDGTYSSRSTTTNRDDFVWLALGTHTR